LPAWFKEFSDKLEKFAELPQFEKFVIVLILLNTLCLASEFYRQPGWLTDIQTYANYFFTVVFALEMIVKMVGFGLKKYVADNFNIFDCFIVIMSYVELIMPDSDSSLSVLRAFRLLRIFKIIKSWDSLRILLSTVLESLQAITNLGVLILLYLFISALLTKQFFHGALYNSTGYECSWDASQNMNQTARTLCTNELKPYLERDEFINKGMCATLGNCTWTGIHTEDDLSRYNFGTTGDALISVFIILTGENWNEIMIQVIDQQDSFYVAVFFIIIMVIGNFMLLNLFLAILLKSISEIGEDDSAVEDDKKEEDAEGEAAAKAEDEAGSEGADD
jgi:hypothetical protein